MIQLPLK